MKSKEIVHVLIVEDDVVDVKTYMRGFRESKIANPVHVASDGVEALEILRGENGRDRIPRPYVILLDLNMPRMGGLELLANLRKDPELSDSIVFVLTTSRAEEDQVAAYKFNVAGCMVKSDVGPSFAGAMTMLDEFWTVVMLPPSTVVPQAVAAPGRSA